MENINNIIDAIIASYQAVPEIVAAVEGETDRIFSWSPVRLHAPSYDDFLEKMPWPSFMVSHAYTELGYRGNMPQWKHTFRIDFKLPADTDEQNYFDVIQKLVDGIPEGIDTLSIIQCSFLDTVDSMEAMVITQQADSAGRRFYRMEFALQEKGGMG